MVPLGEDSPVQAGWLYGNEGAEPAAVVPDWPAVIAARRYQAEVAGLNIDCMHVDTDDRSKLLINGAALEAMIERCNGRRRSLEAAQVIAVARAVRAHV